ncbi:glycosyltransferase family 4 protein [Psychrobacter sp. 1Y11]|uniref:glycosyltransferase family 4 protein n=1 Tax=Psychrobacter sp. 1Y11 TaxID=3457446 RepID=UPI003FCFF3E2
MKIVHIITGLNNGGAEGVLFRLCTHDKNNQHVVISMMDKGKYGALLEKQGITVHCLMLNRNNINFKSLTKLYRLLKQLKPDVVQTWMYHADLIGGLTARFAGYKNIFWNVRNTELKKGSSKNSTIYIAKASALLSHVIPKKIVCCAVNASDIHSELGYDKKKLTVISNGFELNKFSPNDECRNAVITELSLDKVSDIIGMVGRFDPQKDHTNLIKAVHIVVKSRPNLKVLLIGKDMNEDNKTLLDLIKNLNIGKNIIFLDQRTDIPAVMNAMDLHILSSLYGEGFPNVIAEAMACGTPCVTTDVGDSALIVGDLGWVVPVGDSKALANAIITGIKEKDNKAKWLSRKQAVRQRILNNFDISSMVKNYDDVWKT